jgi:predicted nucleic acid-binding Zn ribbon protein
VTWGPQPIGEEVRRELGRFGPQGSMGEIVAAWPAAVGQAIADNAWPARVARDGTLHVATSSSAWAFELTQLEETVRARLAEHLGKGVPPRLRFATGRLPERGAEAVAGPSRKTRTAGPTERALGAEIAAPIDDPELRELVARAAAASLAR